VQERVVVAQILQEQSANGSEVVFEDWRQILTRKVVEQLDAEVECAKVLSEEILVVLVCGDLLICALFRKSVMLSALVQRTDSYLQKGEVGFAEF
jgi:hypothetical protein